MNIPKTKTINLSEAERFCIGLRDLLVETHLYNVTYNKLGNVTYHFKDGSSVGGLWSLVECGILKEDDVKIK